MEDDKFEYQGRSKEQYERNMKVGCYAFVLAAIALAISIIMSISLFHVFWA